MRLINVKTYEIEEFFGSDIPNYVALSHTWLPQEEPSFQDWANAYRSAKTCPDGIVAGMRVVMIDLNKILGYEKIHNFICESQNLDGTYCWADTVCIDKSSSAELSESINSMYKIYKNCERCLVYLQDIEVEVLLENDDFSLLVQSRWFARGWTLQELIAPEHLVFYDREWTYIGSKERYKAYFQEATGIPSEVLLNANSWRAYSVAERMSWASKRTTTREEDMAYCLLGILDINMPLLYGEGEKAFQRLQEEIIKKYDDDSIFAWSCPQSSRSTYRSILARSPSEFANSKGISFFGSKNSEPYMMTNKGLQAHFHGWVVPGIPDEFDVVLNCWNSDQKAVIIRLRRLSAYMPFYARVDSHFSHTIGASLSQQSIVKVESRTVYVREEIPLPLPVPHRSSRARGLCFRFKPRGLLVKRMWRFVSAGNWQCEQPFQYPTHQRSREFMVVLPKDLATRRGLTIPAPPPDKPITFSIKVLLRRWPEEEFFGMHIEFGQYQWCDWDGDELVSLWASVRLGDLPESYDPDYGPPEFVSDGPRLVKLTPTLINDDLWFSTSVPWTKQSGQLCVDKLVHPQILRIDRRTIA